MHGYAYTHIHSHIHTYQDSKAEVVEEHNFRRSSLPRSTCPVRTWSVYYTSIGFLQAVAGTCACEQMYAVLMCVYIHTYVNACIHTGAWHVSTLTQSYVYMFKFACMDTCRVHYTSVGFIPHRGCQSLPRPRSQRARWGTCIYTGASGGHTNGSKSCV